MHEMSVEWEKDRTDRVRICREIDADEQPIDEFLADLVAAREGLSDVTVQGSTRWESGIAYVVGYREPTPEELGAHAESQARFALVAREADIARLRALAAKYPEDLVRTWLEVNQPSEP